MDPLGTPSLERVSLDAETLCHLLARLDAGTLPALPPIFGGTGPQVHPLFRGANAELLMVRWSPGQQLPICALGDSSVAIRPLDGQVELLSFAASEAGDTAQLVQVETIGPGQLAGIPAGAVHAMRAHQAALTLHLCAPPVLLREQFQAAWG